MNITWTLLLSLIALVVVKASGNACNVSFASPCYNKLVQYEGLQFPMYGGDEIELDETCRLIDESFDCLHSYVEACDMQQECDENCTAMISDIGKFSYNTGLRNLQLELCNPASVMRETYLENYSCLENNIDDYDSCHNDSQISQEYMSTIQDPKVAVRDRCCFFSWYQDCFTNITRDTCSVNATVFVSFSLHKLVGHLAQSLCAKNPVLCDRPPMGDLDEDKPDKIDHDIDNDVSGCSSNLLASVYHVIAVLSYVVLSKHVFSIK